MSCLSYASLAYSAMASDYYRRLMDDAPESHLFCESTLITSTARAGTGPKRSEA